MKSNNQWTAADFHITNRLIGNMPMIFYVLDKEWIFTLSEGYGLMKLGLKPGQVVGSSAREMYENFPDIIAAIERAFMGEVVKTTHIIGDSYLENHIVPLYNVHGNIDGVAGASIDITERKKTESELKKTQSLQTAFIESVPGIMYMYDSLGKLKFWNKNHEIYTGYSGEELANMTLMDWYKDDDESQNAILKGLEKTVEKGFGEAEANLQCKDGTIRPTYFTAAPLRIEQEDFFVGIGVDISSRIETEKNLQELNRSLEDKVQERTHKLFELNEELISTNEELVDTNRTLNQMQKFIVESEKMAALGGLVAGVAHEVNTPLGISVTAASHLVDVCEELLLLCTREVFNKELVHSYLEDVQKASTIILNNLEKASHLVHSFKQLSVDQTAEPKRLFDMSEYIHETLLSLSPFLKKTKIQVLVECPEKMLINSYPGAFAQMITNLSMNSIVHGYDINESGIVRIRVEQKDTKLRLFFSDDGKGMSPETLNHIFEPFFTTNRAKGSTGLGLSVLYSIITQQFNGQIQCESELGKGTTFMIELDREVM